MPPRTKKTEPLLPVLTIDDRCGVCRWTLFVSMSGAIFCTKPTCPQIGVDITQEVQDGPNDACGDAEGSG